MAETTAFSQLTTSINQHSVRFFFIKEQLLFLSFEICGEDLFSPPTMLPLAINVMDIVVSFLFQWENVTSCQMGLIPGSFPTVPQPVSPRQMNLIGGRRH